MGLLKQKKYRFTLSQIWVYSFKNMSLLFQKYGFTLSKIFKNMGLLLTEKSNFLALKQVTKKSQLFYSFENLLKT